MTPSYSSRKAIRMNSKNERETCQGIARRVGSGNAAGFGCRQRAQGPAPKPVTERPDGSGRPEWLSCGEFGVLRLACALVGRSLVRHGSFYTLGAIKTPAPRPEGNDLHCGSGFSPAENAR